MTRSEKPGELIHFDICGPMSIKSIGGSNMMAGFVDDFSGIVFIKPIKSKADIVVAVQDIISKATAAGHQIRRLRDQTTPRNLNQRIQTSHAQAQHRTGVLNGILS